MLRARLWRLSCFGINQPAKVIVWSEKTKAKPDNGDKICYYLFIYLFIYLSVFATRQHRTKFNYFVRVLKLTSLVIAQNRDYLRKLKTPYLTAEKRHSIPAKIIK